MRKYESNIEVVDPQLKNNFELVEVLVEFENSWSQGLTYFLDNKKLSQLLHFSKVIEASAEKHKTFSEQLEQRDAEIFLNIPALLVLKCIENDDKDICSIFWPDILLEDMSTGKGKEIKELRKLYDDLRQKFGAYELYNLLEKVIIEVELLPEEKKIIDDNNLEQLILKHIRGLAMQLSRFNPADWNKFLDVVIK